MRQVEDLDHQIIWCLTENCSSNETWYISLTTSLHRQTMWPLMSSLTHQNKYNCFTKPLQPCLERFPWVLPQQKCGPVKTPHTITKMVFVLCKHGTLQLPAAQVTLEAAKASPSAPPEQGAPEVPRQQTSGGKKPKKNCDLYCDLTHKNCCLLNYCLKCVSVWDETCNFVNWDKSHLEPLRHCCRAGISCERESWSQFGVRSCVPQTVYFQDCVRSELSTCEFLDDWCSTHLHNWDHSAFLEMRWFCFVSYTCWTKLGKPDVTSY